MLRVPKIAAPELNHALFVKCQQTHRPDQDHPNGGWYRVLDVITDIERDLVLAVCGDPATGTYTHLYESAYSNHEEVIITDEDSAEILHEGQKAEDAGAIVEELLRE